MEKEKWRLPIDFRKKKKYTGILVYYRKFYISEDLGRVHDDRKLVTHTIEDGKYPLCCKDYLNASSMVDTICKCGKHWIYVEPQGEYQGATEIRIFEVKKMEEKKKSEFEGLMEKADDAYINREYEKSVSLSIDAWNKASDKNEKATAERRMGWAHRYIGFKLNDAIETHYRYNLAKICWKNVLILNPDDIDTAISAVKGLMLLPTKTEEMVAAEIEGTTLILKKEIAELYQLGEEKIEKRAKGKREENNLKAELLNSLGMEVRKYDIETASKIFTCGYLVVELYTTIAGHLQHNKGTCYLMLKNQTKNKVKKLEYAKMAIVYLEWALCEYPEDQVAHITAVQNKIKNTQKEIENNFE